MLTDDELIELRSHIGTATPPTDDELDEMYERLGSVTAVAYEVTRQRLANLVNEPAQFSVPGEYSQNVGENIKALQAKLSELGSAVPVDSGPLMLERDPSWR